MRGRGDDENDGIARNETSVAMDHRHAQKRPATFGFFDMSRDLGFGHPRIVLERHRGDGLAVVHTAADACERHNSADVAAPVREGGGLNGSVERLWLQANGHRFASASSHWREERNLVSAGN